MSKNWKVKVYLLNSDGNWSDFGAGQLNLEKQYDEKQEIEIEFLKVIQSQVDQQDNPTNEEQKLQKLSQSYKQSPPQTPANKDIQNETNILLYLKINKENEYDKQGDSIITWMDKEIDEEVALSFLDVNVASETWRHICQIIGKNPMQGDDQINEQELEKIPNPTKENIQEVFESMENYPNLIPYKISRNVQFLDSLSEIFQINDDLVNDEDDEFMEEDDTKTLEIIYQIFKLLIMTNDPNVLKTLVSDKYYMLTFGAFEYKPENRGSKKVKYRDFMENVLQFKEIMKFEDKSILEKIHQNYRLMYLKDSVIASYIEDTTTNSIANEKNITLSQKLIEVDIFKILCVSSQKLLEKQKFLANDEEQKQKIDIVLIHLLEILTFLVNSDIKEFINYLLQTDQNSDEQQSQNIQNQTPNKKNSDDIEMDNDSKNQKGALIEDEKTQKSDLKKSNIEEEDNEKDLEETKKIPDNKIYKNDAATFLNVIGQLFISKGTGVQIQIGQEIMKVVIDPYNDKKNYIFDVVFSNFISVCVKQFKNPSKQEWYTSFATQFIDLITLVLKSQLKFKLEQFFMKEKIFYHFKTILKYKNKTVNLSIIKFYRAIFQGNHHDKIRKNIIKNGDLDPIIELFITVGNRRNLLNSSLLDLFETMVKSEDFEAIAYIMENWWTKLVDKKLDKLFVTMYDCYQSNQKKIKNSSAKKMDNWSDNSSENMEFMQYISDEEDGIIPDKKEEDKQQENMQKQNLLKLQQKMLKKHKKEQEDEEDSFIGQYQDKKDDDMDNNLSDSNSKEYNNMDSSLISEEITPSLSKSLIKGDQKLQQDNNDSIMHEENSIVNNNIQNTSNSNNNNNYSFNNNNSKNKQQKGIEIGIGKKRSSSVIYDEDNEDEELQMIQQHTENRKIVKTETEIDSYKSSPNSYMINEDSQIQVIPNNSNQNDNNQKNNQQQEQFQNGNEEELQQIQNQNQQQNNTNNINMNINIEQESQ